MKKNYKLAALALATALAFSACGDKKEEGNEASNEASKANEASSSVTEAEAPVSEENSEQSEANEVSSENQLVLHRSYQAPHGEKSFARVVVAMDGDKICDVALDEFQYFDEGGDFKGLVNSDKAFGNGAAEGKILGSKLENAEAYSSLMAEKAQSTTSLDDNYQAIIDFVKGKTVADLEGELEGKSDEEIVDAVTGASLVDTPNYLKAIIETAKDDSMTSVGNYENIDDVELKTIYAAPHDEAGVGDAVVAVEKGKVVAANIDEFQYFEAEGVPNADKEFGEAFADEKNVLASKKVNDEAYSKLMKEYAEATVSIGDNYKAIEEYVAGKTTDELNTVIGENEKGKPVDAVTGATLVDTVGYLQMIVDAANK